ncbi:uroporphyrinogen-III C-methyltransferase [Adhaeribacter aquaticus]|uniref:uroporphyrinogen-III C-methyltransferase n=1 Tax=Adhaeribacter aquaticus TaxID=299567 RepID=UPI0003F5CE29|nr:uroporphyrinogen-III C-methyltransferase [Adhaeribacter aquaticus]
MNTQFPKVTLIGAGPGASDLLTIRGAQVLAKADAVLYDALVNKELLELAPEKAPKIFVGKRSGNHEYAQEEINKMIVQYAQKYGHIVRLKGGDPFVFGRGYEEIAYANSFGVETEVIPGITSAVAVPGACNIPLTSRGVSESFWVITGATTKGHISEDLKLAAQSTATVVILMGMNNLKEITEIFKAVDKIQTPAAVIQNGTRTNQQIVRGTVENIYQLTQEKQIGSPAIIVIGNVVDLNF